MSQDLFSFNKQLISATVLRRPVPGAVFYPMLSKAKLKTELFLIYENNKFRACSGALTLFQFFMENNLQDTFTETDSLLKIFITTPMMTAESVRCFLALQRNKTFPGDTMTRENPNVLAVLFME